MNAQSRFLDLRALAALERMRFTTRHRIEGAYSGCHTSRQQGGAGVFVDYREYAGGEDLRRLDWKVLGRTGKSFVRVYEEETNLLCTLALDTSGSMDFRGVGGTQTGTSLIRAKHPPGRSGESEMSPFAFSKLEYAQFLATALAHVITSGQDQVGLALLGERLGEMLPPGSRLTHLSQLYHLIEEIVPRPTRSMAAGLRDLFERSRRRGVLMMMSDFLMEDLEDVFAALRLFRHRGWEVIILHLVHPEEERLPEAMAFRFEGMEAEGSVDCSPAEVWATYRERFGAHMAMVRQLALAGGCDYRRVSTAIPYLQTLGGFLVERAGI
jgi:uncharacterized protein (DUF58 family)